MSPSINATTATPLILSSSARFDIAIKAVLPHCHPNGWIAALAPFFSPRWRHSPVTPAVMFMQEGADLRVEDLGHGVVQAHPQHAHEEVIGVAGRSRSGQRQ